jgi:hypothetical protein
MAKDLLLKILVLNAKVTQENKNMKVSLSLFLKESFMAQKFALLEEVMLASIKALLGI